MSPVHQKENELSVFYLKINKEMGINASIKNNIKTESSIHSRNKKGGNFLRNKLRYLGKNSTLHIGGEMFYL